MVTALACTGLAGCMHFAGDTGSDLPTLSARPEIPEHYRGLWASRLDHCGAVGDRGMQLQIAASRIGTANVIRVKQADDGSILAVSTDHPDAGQEQLLLALLPDQQSLDVSYGRSKRAADRLLRCPEA